MNLRIFLGERSGGGCLKMKTNETLDMEKRKFPRIKDSIFILYHLSLCPAEEFKAISNDISTGGLMFETERNISKGSKVYMEIDQPIHCDKTMIFCIPVLTKVIWVRKIDKDNFEKGENKYKVGIEFLEIEEVDRNRIAKYIKEERII